jgi:Ner family transcriptional regulator
MDTQKGMPKPDWHPADVKAALEKKGVSLRKLASEYGYSHIQRVLVSQWWAAEQIVAKAIGVPAHVIWPSRYVTPRSRGEGMTRNEVALKAAKRQARKVSA